MVLEIQVMMGIITCPRGFVMLISCVMKQKEGASILITIAAPHNILKMLFLHFQYITGLAKSQLPFII